MKFDILLLPSNDDAVSEKSLYIIEILFELFVHCNIIVL